MWFIVSEPAWEGTPFPFEGPVRPELLIDRRDELDVLARRAADRVNVRLAAPRRFGKTSVLFAHAARLRETGWRVAHVDLARVADITDVTRRFVTGYAPLDPRQVRAWVRPVVSRLGLTLTPAGPGLSLGPRSPDPDPVSARTLLDTLLDLPKSLWERDRTPTLVVFDEFQDLLAGGDNLDGVVRSHIQHHFDAAAYVYAGSEPSLMSALFDRHERPFFGQADPLELGPLPVEETIDDLSARFESEGLDPGDALVDLVIFAGGHPQRTMLLAYLLADHLAGDGPHPELAAAVLDDAIHRLDPVLEALWLGLDASERIVAAAVADGRGPTSRALAEEHRVNRGTLGKAARRLEDHGHLTRVPRASRLVDPLFAEWLRRR